MDRAAGELNRELGVAGASFIGLGSIVGTGVFVSIGLAAAETGAGVVLAIVIAAGLALCNALSSAQLAAAQPVSGGTYEYGYARLTPELGFTAGWMFLCAKSASAATAALGFAGYLLHALGRDSSSLVVVALAAVAAFTLLAWAGLRRSSWMNAAIVSVTLVALTAFILVGLPRVAAAGPAAFLIAPDGVGNLFYATALMFVAYTGYGRIATMGEEVRDPRRVIPAAILITLAISAALYIGVALVAVTALDGAALGRITASSGAPLEAAARALGHPWLAVLVSIGAVTAMLGVLLNLILGLSRMVLAMGRRADLPRPLARIDRRGVPAIAVIAVGLVIGGLALIGSIKLAWSFSAFTVLVYYAITNLAALRMPASERLYWRVFPVLGLAGCVLLAFQVPPPVWATGLGLIAAGLLARLAFRRIAGWGTRTRT